MLLNCTITKVTYPDCKVSFPKNLITSQVGLFSMNVVQKLIEGYNLIPSFPLYTHSFLTLHPENFVFSDCSLPFSLYCCLTLRRTVHFSVQKCRLILHSPVFYSYSPPTSALSLSLCFSPVFKSPKQEVPVNIGRKYSMHT